MKKTVIIILSVLVVTIVATAARAHEGMIALYADETPSSCQAILPELQIIDLSLFYIRGDGPRFGKGCEFRLSKSSSGILLSSPVFSPSHGTVLTLGGLESGIAITYHGGEPNWCAADNDVFLLGTFPVLNLSDPDTFTVSVVQTTLCAPKCGIFILRCSGTDRKYNVIGGTFIFNGDCNSPENPFGSPVGVESSSWGAIKSLYKD